MIHRPSQFLIITAASFISQIGSHLLTLAIAAFAFMKTGSATAASMIFVFSLLPSAVLSTRVGSFIDLKLNKSLLIRWELASLVTTLLCGAVLHFNLPIVLLCLLLCVRSVLGLAARTSAMKWIKDISPQELLSNRIQLFFLGFFISTAISGILASVLFGQDGLNRVIAVDVITYVIAIATLFLLEDRNLALPPAGSIPVSLSYFQTLREIGASPSIAAPFFLIVFSQSIFQGAYTALVTTLAKLKLQSEFVSTGHYQLAASVGITAGFIIVWRAGKTSVFNSRNRLVTQTVLGASALGAIAGAVLINNSRLSLFAFFILNLSYEIIWLFNNSLFFPNTPKSHAARYQFVLSSTASVAMAIAALFYSAAIDMLGVEVATYVFGGAAGFIALVGAYFHSCMSAKAPKGA